MRGWQLDLRSILGPDGSDQWVLGLEPQDGLRLDLDLSTRRDVAAVRLAVVGEVFGHHGNISVLAVEKR